MSRGAEYLRAIVGTHEAEAVEGDEAMVLAWTTLLHAITQADEAGLFGEVERSAEPASPMPDLRVARPAPLADQAVSRILGDIRSGALRDGQKLREEALGREMGVSRTVVREALDRLNTAGIVVDHPHRSSTVSTRYLPKRRPQGSS